MMINVDLDRRSPVVRIEGLPVHVTAVLATAAEAHAIAVGDQESPIYEGEVRARLDGHGLQTTELVIVQTTGRIL